MRASHRAAFAAIVIALAAAATCARPAAALAQPPSLEQQAAKDSAEARRAYELGQFREAVELYKRAYQQKRDPVLLFNLARCYEALATRPDLEQSIEHYEAYLHARPDASDRMAVERRVEVLRQQVRLLEEQSKPKPPPPRVAPPPASPAPKRASALPWIIAGTGAGGLVAGGILGGLAVKKRSDAVASPSGDTAQRLESNAQSLATGANIAFGVGGAAVAAGGVWGVVDVVLSSRKSSTAQAPVLVVGPASILLTHTF